MILKKKKMKGGGKVFPDLTGDGAVTKKDILKGRGVEGFGHGGDVRMGGEKGVRMGGEKGVRMGGEKESHMMPDGSMMPDDDPSMGYSSGGEVRIADVRSDSKRGKTY